MHILTLAPYRMSHQGIPYGSSRKPDHAACETLLHPLPEEGPDDLLFFRAMLGVELARALAAALVLGIVDPSQVPAVQDRADALYADALEIRDRAEELYKEALERLPSGA